MMSCERKSNRKPSSYQLGLSAEGEARDFLERNAYSILAERYRSPAGEIDIIAKRGSHLAFVEVKRRKTEEAAAYAVGARQQKRIALAAEIYLDEHRDLTHCSASFDVILVTPSQGCSHIEQAFFA
jgi:putative endonuclease